MREIKAPEPIPGHDRTLKLFLAGSIEMGTAVDWQRDVARSLGDLPITLLNPRRDDFDPDARQSIDDEYFRGQVEWELEALEAAAIILMYFAPGTKSPVSLLELGLYARSNKLMVVCPYGFWRKGNVDIVCSYYRVCQVPTIREAKERIRRQVARRVEGPGAR